MFNDRFIFASALQKSIRRGRADLALEYADIFAKEDMNYLIYRLGIILTEDVGVSNNDLLNKYLDLKISKKSIEAAGGLPFMKEVIQEACSSIKDRSSCDLAYFSSYCTEWAVSRPEFQAVIAAPPEERLNMIKDFVTQDINPVIKINLIWAALGQRKYPNETLTELDLFDMPLLKNGKKDDNVENFKAILETLKLSEPEIRSTLNAHLTQNEFMCLGMALTFPARNSFIAEQLEKDSNFKPVIQSIDFSNDTTCLFKSYDLPILTAAIDGHTSQGKAAITMFMRNQTHYLEHMSSLGFNTETSKDLLSFFLFRLEGQQVNKREFFPFAKTALTLGGQISLNQRLGFHFNENKILLNDILASLKKDIPLLNDFRERSLNFAPKTQFKPR